jgi:hypothetical protein
VPDNIQLGSSASTSYTSQLELASKSDVYARDNNLYEGKDETGRAQKKNRVDSEGFTEVVKLECL